MARRTAALKPQLNQIRTWARDGRTDAWIAFQLGTTALTVQEFRSEHGLGRGGGNTAEEPVTPEMVVQTISFDTPPPKAEAPVAPAEDAAPAPTRRQRRSRTSAAGETKDEAVVAAPLTAEADSSTTIVEGEPAERAKRRRRRGGRGGGSGAVADGAASEPLAAQPPTSEPAAKRKSRTPASYKGSVVAGAVIVLDPAITRSAAWRANWADAPGFDVVIDDEQIVLRRRSDG